MKDFQPLLAAAVALFAAWMAFRASMAKVRFDLDEAKTKRKAERLADYLRLRMASSHLQGRIRRILDRLETEVEQMEDPPITGWRRLREWLARPLLDRIFAKHKEP